MMDYEAMKTQLTGDFRETFDKAQTYAMTSNFDEAYSDDKMMELYDLLLTAQTEQRPAQQVVGKDAAAFVTNFFSDYTMNWQNLLAVIPDTVKRLTIVVLVVSLLDFFANSEETGFFAARTDISMILAGLIGGVVFLAFNQFVLRPASMKAKKIKNAGWAFIILGLFVGLIVLELAFRKSLELNVPTAPLIIGCGVYLLGFYAVRSVWRLKKYGTVRDIRRQHTEDSYYKNLPNRDIERAYMEGLLKRYQHLARKGKVTEDAFLAKMEREEKWVVRSNFIFTVFMVAMILYSIVKVALESTVIDTLFYALIVGVIEWFIWKLFIGSSKKSSAVRQRIYAACSKCGMTLPAYLESELESVHNA